METGNASIGRSLVLILFTGLRLGETVGLMWDDIDFQKRTFKVQRTLEYVKNRDGDESEVHPKSWTKVMRQSHFEFCIGQDLTHSIFL